MRKILAFTTIALLALTLTTQAQKAKTTPIENPPAHSRQSNNCKSLIMNENIFTTPFLLETGFCFITFTISKNFLVF